ncbi:MAG: hypothetical protein EXQ95_15545 [Alphaproteobacteria bacterium]|nr:hypothetical protein [Alphaproteobacteria bacterium]
MIPPPGHMPQAQPQQPVQPEVVQLSQTAPIAAQTQRAIAGPSRGRGADRAKSDGRRAATGAEEKTAEAGKAQRQRKREGGVTIDV